jgi:hypothetical protein
MTTGYLSLPAAAAYLGRSARWLRRRLDRVRHFRPDGSPLFRRQDLDAFIESFVVEPAELPRVDLDAILGSLERRPRRRRAGGAG